MLGEIIFFFIFHIHDGMSVGIAIVSYCLIEAAMLLRLQGAAFLSWVEDTISAGILIHSAHSSVMYPDVS